MFDAPKSTRGIGGAPANSAKRRIRSVVRIYTWIGWPIVVVYVPVVVFCAIAFLIRLYGKQFGPPGTPLMILQERCLTPPYWPLDFFTCGPLAESSSVDPLPEN